MKMFKVASVCKLNFPDHDLFIWGGKGGMLVGVAPV